MSKDKIEHEFFYYYKCEGDCKDNVGKNFIVSFGTQKIDIPKIEFECPICNYLIEENKISKIKKVKIKNDKFDGEPEFIKDEEF